MRRSTSCLSACLRRRHNAGLRQLVHDWGGHRRRGHHDGRVQLQPAEFLHGADIGFINPRVPQLPLPITS
eukprot:5440876-Prymnesium_polylepis.1